MKILALETIDVSAGIALLEDENVLASAVLPPQQRSAQFLAPAVRDLLESQGWKPSDVQLVAIAQGPGSFTGLRVGIAFAKIFAYAVGADVIALNTLELLAQAAPRSVSNLSAALDAQRNQVICQRFTRDENGMWTPQNAMELLDLEDWAGSAPEGVFLTGPVLKQKAKYLPDGLTTLPEECWQISSSVIGKTAFRLYEDGRRDDIWNLLPIYSRPAAAEERKNAKKA
ncbi:MAG: tRNA (adenosine(37)-N6)-threonylcarbamoyltransferase complex dimerization subunit type 1 TsaB [Thermoguttaceae bacterium]|nr:tRNA (adenosine(37)-N6)-threonylcarbamoyltransferase complex dimerization subunit type 1 TsaB [Planctomycetaceae bacterium]MBQ4144601.1 tRNA (adenosine(37)-N6)-threonylcarbamoyltransferase complex dimerization subunit type 1 TsaB [Thermoguttaceae bacterium]